MTFAAGTIQVPGPFGGERVKCWLRNNHFVEIGKEKRERVGGGGGGVQVA